MGASTRSRTLVFATLDDREVTLHADGPVGFNRQRRVQQIANRPYPIRNVQRDARRGPQRFMDPAKIVVWVTQQEFDPGAALEVSGNERGRQLRRPSQIPGFL